MAVEAVAQRVPTQSGRQVELREDAWNSRLQPALREMKALGLRVSAAPQSGSRPYRLLFGRSGARWFLLPSRPRAVCATSLAFVQPMRAMPRVFKQCAVAMARVGLAGLWGRQVVHVSGSNRLAGVFDPELVHDAFFSGTAGPHRKLVVQFMDSAGCIKGYAKVACAPAVHTLLVREAAIMQELGRIGLRSAVIPRVLFNEIRAGAAVLVMDTVDAPRKGLPSRLQAAHLDFLDELAARTGATWARSGDVLLRSWEAQARSLDGHLSLEWRNRLARAQWMLTARPELVASRGLAHGDFTPVNTLTNRGELFVFDWEYAGGDYPADFDLIRYLDAWMRPAGTHPWRRAEAILRVLVGELGRSRAEAYSRLVAYQCVYALRGVGRQPPSTDGTPLHWESECNDAAMLDALLAHPRLVGLQG
jgi:hypothetical protein